MTFEKRNLKLPRLETPWRKTELQKNIKRMEDPPQEMKTKMKNRMKILPKKERGLIKT